MKSFENQKWYFFYNKQSERYKKFLIQLQLSQSFSNKKIKLRFFIKMLLFPNFIELAYNN